MTEKPKSSQNKSHLFDSHESIAKPTSIQTLSDGRGVGAERLAAWSVLVATPSNLRGHTTIPAAAGGPVASATAMSGLGDAGTG